MMRIGLSGGIGSGKSTVSTLLGNLGATVIDADQIARAVVEPGTTGLQQIQETFGEEVIADDGTLNRPALAAIVFADTDRRKELEAITHPLIGERTAQLFREAPADAIVVHDMPLLVELGQTNSYHLMVIVDVPAHVRLDRLVEQRGMTRADAEKRIAAQASDEQRREAADVLLDNSRGLAELEQAVKSLWHNRIQPYADNLQHDRPVRRPDTVQIVDPDPDWAVQARRLCRRIAHQLDAAGFTDVRIDHIGSTAVPGLPAKDVIDLQLQVTDLSVAHQEVGDRVTRTHGAEHVDSALVGCSFKAALKGAGFTGLRPNEDHAQAWAPDPDLWRKYFANGADPGRLVHLHIRQAGGPASEIALQFRDWLRADDTARDAYAHFKHATAQAHPGGTPDTKQDYVEAKEPWFAQALPKARAWAEQTGWAIEGHPLR
ncbi:dephospho-CoA kinase [Yimella sp. cx-51]|uniref:dephospho-CoA kinase n=1 Tax=Yimella sp. cx-51 TaxID=2770551 RepID=UPI00165D451E|nr:dephospho-CoA kinase [Yimella sp. cx-51]MBC9957446.1 dephospho-CoA kinase [Yimella sp. cx-51]QTH39317.1 dephospho-CoA kinase [Yimella sp. cx-51]